MDHPMPTTIARPAAEAQVVDEKRVSAILSETRNPSRKTVLDVLDKARRKAGLGVEEVGVLIHTCAPDLEERIRETARFIKDEIYGERLVFFAPLYLSDFCVNDCAYCNFHARNKDLRRKKLTLDEIEQQAKVLIGLGHKRLLLECGEDPVGNTIEYVLEAIERIYSVRTGKGNIRRINVNIAATTVENYRKLKQAGIGTYQLFQETYHRPTYEKLHRGPKADFVRQITAHERAFEAGLDDLGLGVLFGLYDWRFEVLALVSHAQSLEKRHGAGPHTISVPRFRPAPSVTYQGAHPVSDGDFLKLIAILRLAVPYTGMILSTRESAETRKVAFKIGISQASAGSVTTVGGYGGTRTAWPSRDRPDAAKRGAARSQPQFAVQDERKLEEVIEAVLADDLLPSFCTACYRVGRTGERFMGLAKPGDIHDFCRPNGILTFAEYLEDFGRSMKNGMVGKGYEVIHLYLDRIDNAKLRNKTRERLEKIRQGERDLYF